MKRKGVGYHLKAALREMLGPWNLSDPAAFTTGKGADLTRLTLDWIASCRSPDDEVRGTMRRLRARARELERNNAYAANYLQLLSDNVIGPHGFTHQAQVRNNDGNLNKQLNDKIEEAFADWCRSVTRDGKLGLVQLEQLLMGTVARDGEVLVRKVRGPKYAHGLALEPVDADLLDESFNRPAGPRDNEVRMGVEVDEDARPVAYHIFSDLYSLTRRSLHQRERVPAEDMIHLYRPRRVNQTRGVTWFLPVMIPLRMLDGYEEAELVAARVAAAKMGFFTAKDEDVSEFNEGTGKGPITMEANPGSAEQLPPGWSFESWDPTHPTNAFGPFVKGTLRKIASGLHVSYNGLTSDLESVNYSSMRSGLLIERDTWRSLQDWWICSFRQAIYREWLSMATLSGDLVLDTRDFRKFTAVKWTPRGWAWVDPQKDTAATVQALGFGLSTRTDALAEQGKDLETVLMQLAEEQELAEELGVKIDGPPAPAATTAMVDQDEQDKKDTEATTAKNGHGRLAALLREE
ncbi:MAG TPA: phage portal protein [Gemmatimonadales bacterium]